MKKLLCSVAREMFVGLNALGARFTLTICLLFAMVNVCTAQANTSPSQTRDHRTESASAQIVAPNNRSGTTQDHSTSRTSENETSFDEADATFGRRTSQVIIEDQNAPAAKKKTAATKKPVKSAVEAKPKIAAKTKSHKSTAKASTKKPVKSATAAEPKIAAKSAAPKSRPTPRPRSDFGKISDGSSNTLSMERIGDGDSEAVRARRDNAPASEIATEEED